MRSAISRQWYSDPPRISMPYRWTIKAIRTALRSEGGKDRRQPLLNHTVPEILKSLPLSGQHFLTRTFVEGEHAEQLSGVLEVLRRKLYTRAAKRVGNGRGAVRQHRYVHCHRLDERHAEPFVLAERDIHTRRTVIGRELDVRH